MEPDPADHRWWPRLGVWLLRLLLRWSGNRHAERMAELQADRSRQAVLALAARLLGQLVAAGWQAPLTEPDREILAIGLMLTSYENAAGLLIAIGETRPGDPLPNLAHKQVAYDAKLLNDLGEATNPREQRAGLLRRAQEAVMADLPDATRDAIRADWTEPRMDSS